MNKIKLLFAFVLGAFSVFSQDECFQRLDIKTLEINRLETQLDSIVKSASISEQHILDSLGKESLSLQTSINDLSKAMQDTVLVLNAVRSNLHKKDKELAKYEDFKKNRKEYLQEKEALSLEIENHKSTIQKKDNEIEELKSKNAENSKIRYAEGKEFVLNELESKYNKKSFDELINEATEKNIDSDFQLLKQNELSASLLKDLGSYFKLKEVLKNKYNEKDNQVALEKLNSLMNKYTESESIKTLVKTVKNYKDANNVFKNCLIEISKLDEIEQVSGMSSEIRMSKFRKISGEFSPFYIDVINRGITVNDYPYLNDIMHQVFDIKINSVDAEIGSLIEKI